MHPAPDSSASFAAVQHHLYDAQGERGLKGLGTITEFYVNGETMGYGASLGNYVRYVSGYFVVDGHGRVSKHYYAGSERVVSRLAGDVAGYLEAEDLEGEQLSTLRSRQQRDVQAAIKTWDLQIFPFLNYPKPTDNCSLYPSGSEEHKQCVCDQQNTCTEVLYWYHPDHLGSSTFLSDAAGEPYQFVLYLPFGELFAEQRAAEWSTPYLFNAKELDSETGLYYYGARYYDPRVSTWWVVDPLTNKYPKYSPYTYTLNNPVRFVDPDGMRVEDIIVRGANGESFNWTPESTYDGDDIFIHQSVSALNLLSANPGTANFSFKGKRSSGVNFKGNAVLDYASGGTKDYQNVFIEHADNNPSAPGENEHIAGTVYWDPARGIAEEGFNGVKGGGSFPSMGLLIHEMGHAALFNEFGGSDWQSRSHIFANEEQMIIDWLEKPAMQSLGFGYRTSYNTERSKEEFHKNNLFRMHLPFKGSYYIPSTTPISLK